MAYQCPRCGDKVRRGSSTAASAGAGLVGALFYAAFGSFQCPKCGKISRSEFPPEARAKMLLGSAAMVVGAIVLVILVIWLITVIE